MRNTDFERLLRSSAPSRRQLLQGLTALLPAALLPACSLVSTGVADNSCSGKPALSERELMGIDSSHLRPLSSPLAAALHPEVIDAFMVLREEAAQEGIDLRVASGFRSFARQQQIWNLKATGQRNLYNRQGKLLDGSGLSPRELVRAILIWSALPGASRHHWGTDLDVYDEAARPSGYAVQLSEAEAIGVFARLHRWLDRRIATGHSHGFYRPYDGRGGISPELWHLSYQPLADRCACQMRLELLRQTVADSDMELKEEVMGMLEELYADYVAPYLVRAA